MWWWLVACTTTTPPAPPADPYQAMRDGCEIGLVSECLALGAELWETDREGGLAAYAKACELGHEVACTVVSEEGPSVATSP
jgi:hypothetical protein